nr:hypothetical protein [Candidatus Njordarchaeum guaymaensis]
MSSSKKFAREIREGRRGHRALAPTLGGAIVLLVFAPLIFALFNPFFDQLLRPLIGNWVDLFRMIGFPWDLLLGFAVGSVGFAYAV